MKEGKKILRGLLFTFLIMVLSMSSTSISSAGEKGNHALYFPASEVSNDDYTWWYSLVSLSDPRLHPVGFDYNNTSITVEAWIKPEKPQAVIMGSGNLSARKTTDGFILYMWKGASPDYPEGCSNSEDYSCVKFAVKTKGVWNVATAYTPADLTNSWHHVAGVLDINAEALTVYVDGNLLKGADDNHPNPKMGVPAIAESGSLFIGTHQAFTPEETIGHDKKKWETHPKVTSWFKGAIDEVRLWKEARTEDQIRKCMNQELGTKKECEITDKLATYLKFNEGTGSTVWDSSGHGNNGSFRYYKNAKKVKKEHSMRIGYHTQVQDPESLEIQDPANWVAGFPSK